MEVCNEPYTLAQRFSALVQRSGPQVLPTGEASAVVVAVDTPALRRKLEAAAYILRVDISYSDFEKEQFKVALARRP